jgi:hypothetical protein
MWRTRGWPLRAISDDKGSHYAVGVEVPIEVVNALGDSILEAQEVLRTRPRPVD